MPQFGDSRDFDYKGLYDQVFGIDTSGGSKINFVPPGSNVARVTPEGLNVNKVQTVAVDPFTGSPIKAGGTSVTARQLQAMREVSGAQQQPITHTAIPTQERLTGTPAPQLAFAGDQNTGTSATAAIESATQPWGPGPRARPFAAPLFGSMPAPNGAAVPDTDGLYGIPAQGFALKPPPPTVRSVIAGRQGSQASGSNPAVTAALVRLASGSSVPAYTMGGAQGGRYAYQVQPDGSVINTVTGRVTATPSGPVGMAAVANAPAPAPTLNQIVYGQSHDFGPGYRPF
jgi:hypothetical protein